MNAFWYFKMSFLVGFVFVDELLFVSCKPQTCISPISAFWEGGITSMSHYTSLNRKKLSTLR